MKRTCCWNVFLWFLLMSSQWSSSPQCVTVKLSWSWVMMKVWEGMLAQWDTMTDTGHVTPETPWWLLVKVSVDTGVSSARVTTTHHTMSCPAHEIILSVFFLGMTSLNWVFMFSQVKEIIKCLMFTYQYIYDKIKYWCPTFMSQKEP